MHNSYRNICLRELGSHERQWINSPKEEDLFVFGTDTVHTRTVKSSAFQCPPAYSKGLTENPPKINTKVHFHFSGSEDVS